MFKRFNKKADQGMSPVERTIYEDEYSNYKAQTYEVGLEEENNWGQQPPPRPSRDNVSGLPPLPFQQTMQHQNLKSNLNRNAEPRSSYMRPASSIYSQGSPNLPDSSFPRQPMVASSVYNDEEVEISPPSSPDIRKPQNLNRTTSQLQVSPIMSPVDGMPDVSRLELDRPPSQSKVRPGSNIPILRREKRRNQVTQAAANLLSKNQNGQRDGVRDKKTQEPLYDPMTGELTTSDRGKRQQVKPGEFSPPSKAPLGPKTTVTSPGGQGSFGDRVRKLKENNTALPSARPEWKGSSGRSQPVPPVADQPDIPPLRIPAKSALRSNSPQISDSGSATPVSTTFRSGQSHTPVVSPTTSGYSGPTIRKTAPSITGRDYTESQYHVPSPTSYNTQTSAQQYPSQPPISTSREGLPHPHNNEPISTIERNFREALKDVSLPGSYEQLPSRFSVTTYATTTTSTPRASEDSVPPMPTPPSQNVNIFEPNSVLNRQRPKIGKSLDSTRQIARKAVGDPVFISMSSASRRNSKMLPKSPAEVQSTDLISSLEAQLDNLKQRRINIMRSIHQMTELMPTDPLARGMEALRQAEEKRKVEMLREDLADVQREEHELGLRLHRAWKRRDSEAVYEPTGLWVRRVTG